MKDKIINLHSDKTEIAKHISSNIQADTLFTFTKKLDYLTEWLSNRRLFARYNIEDIDYLGIENLHKIAFPMKCFCDINLHRLKDHVANYGYYGLAFTKEWGMKNGVQAVQYINPYSELKKDISFILNRIFSLDNEIESEELANLKSYAIHQLLYYKPYSNNERCFTDESEWRYIPQVPDDLPPILRLEQDMGAERLILLNDILKSKSEIAIPFDIEDIKYIIIKKEDEFDSLINIVDDFYLDSIVRDRLLSKILVWDTSRGDF